MTEILDNIPKLRFTDFGDNWQLKGLHNIIDSLESGVSVNSLDRPISKSFEKGILKTSCISSGMFFRNENKVIVESELDRAKLNPTKNTILISRMNTPALVGQSGHVDVDFPNLFIPDRIWMARINNEIAYSKFVSIVLSSASMMGNISNIATGTSASMKNISKPNFLNLKIFIPSLPEQQKIASFLTAVDDKIQLLNKKKVFLEKYKKGVMQQIFDQEIRFKDDDGKDYPNWKEKTLGEICYKKSSNISANTLEENIGEYIIYGASGLLKYVDFYQEEASYISIVKDGAGVGRVFLCEPKTSVLGTLDKIFNNEGVNLYFVLLLLQQVQFAQYTIGSTIPHIYFKDYSKKLIGLPIIFEQTKIANFLSAIDHKIYLVTKQIELTQQYKKGLLQQMFV